MENKNNTNHTGLVCPKCKFKIKFTIQDLILNTKVECPSCHLTLDMNVPNEIKSHLQEIALAEKMVKDAQKFNR